jgi:hypothetical protein
MSFSQGLLLGVCALSLYSLGQVWLVQLSSYRLWSFVGASEFRAYHEAWWRTIWGVVLAPAALLIVASALMLSSRAPGVPVWAGWSGFALQLLLFLGTAAFWGPLMARLEKPEGGLSAERYHLLMTTHWLRVAIVSAYAGLLLWMLTQSAWGA